MQNKNVQHEMENELKEIRNKNRTCYYFKYQKLLLLYIIGQFSANSLAMITQLSQISIYEISMLFCQNMLYKKLIPIGNNAL